MSTGSSRNWALPLAPNSVDVTGRAEPGGRARGASPTDQLRVRHLRKHQHCARDARKEASPRRQATRLDRRGVRPDPGEDPLELWFAESRAVDQRLPGRRHEAPPGGSGLTSPARAAAVAASAARSRNSSTAGTMPGSVIAATAAHAASRGRVRVGC